MSDFIDNVRKNAEAVGGVGYWSWNLGTNEVYWSAECYKIYGRDPETWVPGPDNYNMDIFDDDREIMIEKTRPQIAKRERYHLVYRYYKGSDRDNLIWVRTDCDFMMNDHDELCIIGVTRDITEQKQTEFALENSRKRFEAFADATSDWFWEMDENLRFTYMSKRVEKTMGIPVSFFLGKTRREVAGEVIDNEKWRKHFADLEARRPFRDFRFLRKAHDGSVLYVTTSGIPVFDEAGTFKGYSGASSSLTGRLGEEEKAHLVHEQLAVAINALSDAFVLWDPQDRLVVCNHQFRTINKDIIEATEPGTRFKDHIRAILDNEGYPAMKGKEEAWLSERIKRHANPAHSFEVVSKSGQWFLIKEQKLLDGSTITIISDVTERKKQEQDLHLAIQNAEFANRAKGDFLAHMTHELRTPLNAIIGFSQICESEMFGKQSNPKYVEYASDIRVASTHLLDVISDVLDVSKLEKGEYQIDESVFPIENAIEACLTMVAGRAAAKQITVNSSVEPEIGQLKADQRLFKQIILNLLSNSIKFTSDGGEISITVCVATDQGIIISVIDNGKGIASEDIDKILEPYVQVRDNPALAYGGTGLGLPIVKGLTELHGGNFAIESELGVGTKATVHLPHARTVAAGLKG